jgi:hypothetical protein
MPAGFAGCTRHWQLLRPLRGSLTSFEKKSSPNNIGTHCPPGERSGRKYEVRSERRPATAQQGAMSQPVQVRCRVPGPSHLSMYLP